MKSAAQRKLVIVLAITAAVFVAGVAVSGLFAEFLMLIGLTALGVVLVDIPLILLISAIVGKTKIKSAKAQEPVSEARIPETVN